MLEHVFVSELLQEAWFRYGMTIEVLHSEVDSAGYDIVLEFGGVIRHVQLKRLACRCQDRGSKDQHGAGAEAERLRGVAALPDNGRRLSG